MDASIERVRAWLRAVGALRQEPGKTWPLTNGEVLYIVDALEVAERERDEARAEVERLLEQVRVWRTLARDGSIASVDLAVIGSDEAALAMGRIARRASQHAAQGAVAERDACAEVAEAWLRDAKEITQDSPEEIADAIRARGAR